MNRVLYLFLIEYTQDFETGVERSSPTQSLKILVISVVIGKRPVGLFLELRGRKNKDEIQTRPKPVSEPIPDRPHDLRVPDLRTGNIFNLFRIVRITVESLVRKKSKPFALLL